MDVENENNIDVIRIVKNKNKRIDIINSCDSQLCSVTYKSSNHRTWVWLPMRLAHVQNRNALCTF
jgi:hypothetical protein